MLYIKKLRILDLKKAIFILSTSKYIGYNIFEGGKNKEITVSFVAP